MKYSSCRQIFSPENVNMRYQTGKWDQYHQELTKYSSTSCFWLLPTSSDKEVHEKKIAEEIISTTVIRSIEDELPRIIENSAPLDLGRFYKACNWSNEDVCHVNFYTWV